VKQFTSSDQGWGYHGADPKREASMPTPEDFNPENCRIYWPAILAVFAVQMTALIAISIAVANHSNSATASSPVVKAKLLKR
jgi:hypothetical protein